MARTPITIDTPLGKRYEVRWSWYDADNKRHFKSARFRTLKEADAKQLAVANARASANMPNENGGKQALDVYAQDWLKDRRDTAKPSTFRSYEAIYNASVKPAFGRQRVNAITPADVREWVRTLRARKLAPPTIKHHVWVLRQIFALAAEDRAITYNPALGIKLPTDESVGRRKPEPRFLTGSEVEDVAAQLIYPYNLLVRFTAWTGLRAAEVSGLNIGDVNLMRKELHVTRTRARRGGVWTEGTPKTKTSTRRVRIVWWIADDLLDYLAQHPHRDNPDAPFWPGTRSGGNSYAVTPDSPRSGRVDYSVPFEPGTFYRRRFIPACIAAGVAKPGKGNGVRFHDLRHTFASLCNSEGISSQQVAKWMGHASDVITREIYTHLFEADTAQAIEALGSSGRPTTTPAAQQQQPPLQMRAR